jgi:hypothetical protein
MVKSDLLGERFEPVFTIGGRRGFEHLYNCLTLESEDYPKSFREAGSWVWPDEFVKKIAKNW